MSHGETSLDPAVPFVHGQNGSELRPDLAVVTGSLDRVWQVLDPDHPDYDFFWGAWQFQEEWDWRRHAWFWEDQLGRWPRRPGRPNRSGLKAQRAAVWLRAGFSKAQIEEAFGYGQMQSTSSIWTIAREYAEWLAAAPMLRPDGLQTVAFLEEAFAAGVDPALRVGTAGYVLSSPPFADGEAARRHVRRRYRAPRVVTREEAEGLPFAWPEHISTQWLYTEADLAEIERAERKLFAEKPYWTQRQHAA